jgi:hypothetical protein
MDEGRNVCLLFPPSVDRGLFPQEKKRWKETFEAEYVLLSYTSTVLTTDNPVATSSTAAGSSTFPMENPNGLD